MAVAYYNLIQNICLVKPQLCRPTKGENHHMFKSYVFLARFA